MDHRIMAIDMCSQPKLNSCCYCMQIALHTLSHFYNWQLSLLDKLPSVQRMINIKNTYPLTKYSLFDWPTTN